MSDQHPSSNTAAAIRCPRCGETSAGKFCSGCGAPLRDVRCAHCGSPVAAGARFCNDCGTPIGAVSSGGIAARGEGNLFKLVGIGALAMLLTFVAGEAVGRRSGGSGDNPPEQVAAAVPAGAPAAPDISTMSPEERASRLFNRVMSYSEQGKLDSARFFAPMAVQAYAMLGPPDPHTRYDIGEIYLAVGEFASARMEADSILAAQPNHLLGLALGARAAEKAGDAAAAARFRQRLAAAAPAERGKGLKEYTEHARDIDEALKKPMTTAP